MVEAEDKKIILELTQNEFLLVSGIIQLYNLTGFQSIHESKREIGRKLAEKLMLLSVRRWSEKAT